MIITFVTGASCSGKTETANALRSLLADDEVVDLDAGVHKHPNAGHLDWLGWRAAEELYRIGTQNTPTGHAWVFGISWPHKIVDAAVNLELHDVTLQFICLTVTDKERNRRLEDRLKDVDPDELAEYQWYNRRLDQTLRGQARHQAEGTVAGWHDRSRVAMAKHLLDLSEEMRF